MMHLDLFEPRKARVALACALVLAGGGLAGCFSAPAGGVEKATQARAKPDLVMRWDHLPQGAGWTRASMAALEGHGAALADLVPADIADWCPDYPNQPRAGRNAFWAGMLSTLAKHESTWREGAVGGGGRWFGLVQIQPSTARGYGCAARSGAALKDGGANLSCAIRIMAHTVPRDGVVARGGRGIAADWGPFHSARKREDMRAWVKAQPYCRVPS